MKTEFDRLKTDFAWSDHICDVIKQNELELANTDFKIRPIAKQSG